jgi:hypothetical protein
MDMKVLEIHNDAFVDSYAVEQGNVEQSFDSGTQSLLKLQQLASALEDLDNEEEGTGSPIYHTTETFESSPSSHDYLVDSVNDSLNTSCASSSSSSSDKKKTFTNFVSASYSSSEYREEGCIPRKRAATFSIADRQDYSACLNYPTSHDGNCKTPVSTLSWFATIVNQEIEDSTFSDASLRKEAALSLTRLTINPNPNPNLNPINAFALKNAIKAHTSSSTATTDTADTTANTANTATATSNPTIMTTRSRNNKNKHPGTFNPFHNNHQPPLPPTTALLYPTNTVVEGEEKTSSEADDDDESDEDDESDDADISLDDISLANHLLNLSTMGGNSFARPRSCSMSILEPSDLSRSYFDQQHKSRSLMAPFLLKPETVLSSHHSDSSRPHYKNNSEDAGASAGSSGVHGAMNNELSLHTPYHDDNTNYIGIYSPQRRKLRIQKFIEKRKFRMWTKKVKYDVRKNFADSRVRIKGRFVKKGEGDVSEKKEGEGEEASSAENPPHAEPLTSDVKVALSLSASGDSSLGVADSGIKPDGRSQRKNRGKSRGKVDV